MLREVLEKHNYRKNNEQPKVNIQPFFFNPNFKRIGDGLWVYMPSVRWPRWSFFVVSLMEYNTKRLNVLLTPTNVGWNKVRSPAAVPVPMHLMLEIAGKDKFVEIEYLQSR